MQNKYNGFELFNDIEDEALRTRNRAVVLANMYEDNSKGGKISPKGASLLLGYFQAVPEAARQSVQQEFVKKMAERGFRIAA